MAADEVDRPLWPPDPVLSVILITRNGSRTIEGQLGAVLSQEWARPWELVVVDNESDDTTPDIVCRWMTDHPRLRMVSSVGVHNVAAANTGVAAARGEFVVVVDDDDLVGDGWLAALGEAVMEHHYVVARLDVTQINDEVVRRARRPPIQSTRIDDWYGIPTASGPTAVMPRDWFLAVGGNNEALAAGEDIEFGIRIYAAYGVAPHFVPEAVYHYRLKTDFRSSLRQGVHYGRVDPAIFRLHRDKITHQPRIGAALAEWGRLTATVPLCLFDPARRLRWGFRAGLRWGRVVGSVRNRVIFL